MSKLYLFLKAFPFDFFFFLEDNSKFDMGTLGNKSSLWSTQPGRVIMKIKI